MPYPCTLQFGQKLLSTGVQVVWAWGLKEPDEGSYSNGWMVTAGLPSVWRYAPHGSSALNQLPPWRVSYLVY